MIKYIISSIVIIYILWAVSFLVLWIAIGRLARMITTVEEAIDYIFLKDKLEKLPEEKLTKIENKLDAIKERIRKDFDI